MYANIPHEAARTNGLPDDEHMTFETFRRCQDLNENIILKSVHFFLVYVT